MLGERGSAQFYLPKSPYQALAQYDEAEPLDLRHGG